MDSLCRQEADADMGIYYNENGELRYYEEIQDTVTCQNCGKKYIQMREEQVPGFRDRSDNICPYCHAENGSSMEWDYTNTPLEQ